MENIVAVIAQVGFPIVCCLLLWKALVDEKDAHKEETAKLTEAVNNNTQALIKLAERLDSYPEQEGKH